MKTYYTEEDLQTGDFVIAMHNYGGYDLGFYLGEGSGESHQFYSIYSLSFWFYDKNYEKPPRKRYISKAGEYSFIKYSAELITKKEVLETYKKAIEALKILKIKER